MTITEPIKSSHYLYRSREVFSVLVLFFFILSSSAFAQNNLQFYLDAAVNNNPSLKENVNLTLISRIDKSIVESQYSLPQISLTSNYMFTPYFNNGGRILSGNPDPNAIGYDPSITNGGLYSALINVEKNIFNGGIIDTYKNQHDLKIKSNENSSELLKHNIYKDVTDQYLTVIQSQKLFRIAAVLADTIEKQLEITGSLVRRGIFKQSDYLLLKIEVDNQKIAAEGFRNDLRKNLSDLNTLCGLKDTSLVDLSDLKLDFADGKRGAKFLSHFTIDSLQIANQQDIFETKYKPQVNLFFNTGLNAVETTDIQKRFGLSAGINFAMPIYDGDQKNLSRQQAEISLKTVGAYRENQTVQIINKINESKAAINFYKKNLKSLSDQINSYEELLKFARAELSQGQRSMTEYITLIRSYLELKKDLAGTESSYQQAINQYNYWNW